MNKSRPQGVQTLIGEVNVHCDTAAIGQHEKQMPNVTEADWTERLLLPEGAERHLTAQGTWGQVARQQRHPRHDLRQGHPGKRWALERAEAKCGS